MTELDQHIFLALPVDADSADGKGSMEGRIRGPAIASCVTSGLTRTHCPVFSPVSGKFFGSCASQGSWGRINSYCNRRI